MLECPVLECPATQYVRDWCPTLSSAAENTMQLFMWQRNVVLVVPHYIWDCFDVFGGLDDAPYDASIIYLIFSAG